MAVGLIGIIGALILFLILTYRGFSTFYVAAICAVIVAITNGLNPVTAFAETYVGGITDMVMSLFSVIFLGAIMGKLFLDTGSAASIADTLIGKFIKDDVPENKKVLSGMLILIIIAGLCTMGGIDAYIQVFTLFPVTLIIAEECDIPRRFVPGLMTLNTAFVVAPGAPQIMNVLAVGTMHGAGVEEVGSTSGFVPGLIAVLIVGFGGFFTLYTMIMNDKNQDKHFDLGDVPSVRKSADRSVPPFILAILPLISVFVCYTILKLHIAVALTSGILILLVFMQQYLPREKGGQQLSPIESIKNSLNEGADTYPGAMAMIATPAAFAAVITATNTFGALVEKLGGLSINVMVLTFICVAVIVLFTSAPPAALMISLPMVLGIAQAQGIDVNPHLIMRIAVLTSVTFESLPWNGTILLMQKINHTTHKESYMPYFFQTVLWTTLAALAAVLISLAFPGLK